MDVVKQQYSYDIILLQSSLTVPQEEENPYTYRIRLYNDFVELTEDRLFVDQFNRNPIGSFVASPCNLVGSLTTKGISVNVYADGTLFGCGNCKPSDDLLRNLADPTFSSKEAMTVVLRKGKKIVGQLGIKLFIGSVDPDLE